MKTKIYDEIKRNDFTITQIEIWNRYTQNYFLKYMIQYKDLLLGTIYNYPDSDKLSNFKKDIESGIYELKDSCNLNILKYN